MSLKKLINNPIIKSFGVKGGFFHNLELIIFSESEIRIYLIEPID